ncbi:hypothetical protein C8R48DRAFT_670407 [Suillus tomentosus]|nr:hypothetical protein C8R48DRAFT_670407 [Suillus tomentosus]
MHLRCAVQDDFNFETHNDPSLNILDGSEPVDISHAGGEFHELTRELLGEFYNMPDYRMRCDRTRRRTEAFDRQMPALTKAYLNWHLSISNSASGAEKVPLTILLMDSFIASALILTSVNMLVDKALRRGDPHWRLKHACPACTYKLQGEVPMKFSLLYAMDGNDSLKRVLKKSTQDDLDTDNNSPLSLMAPTLCPSSCMSLASRIRMEYWQKLLNQSGSKKDLDAATVAWTVTTPSTVEFGLCDIASMNRIKTTRRHAMENYEKDLKAVQELETKFGVTCRWEQEDQAWKEVGRLVANQEFQRALDHLEGLVVARIFELSKMNQVGMISMALSGYKLRKHIGKALQVWSVAIWTALDRYNTAAQALRPLHASLSWEEVIEYAFLSDFDLLHDARQDISQRPWATLTGCLTMDTYFKMRHAHEEIQRLDIEIRCLATYLHNKSQYLTECEKQLQTLHPGLAHQVSLHRKICMRFAGHHYQRLHDISMLKGFTRSITPVCIPAQLVADGLIMVHGGKDDALEDLEDDENADMDGEEHAHVLESILQVTLDV